MSRKRARDEDEENLVEIDEDAVSVSESSGYDPKSSPMKISPSTSPGPALPCMDGISCDEDYSNTASSFFESNVGKIPKQSLPEKQDADADLNLLHHVDGLNSSFQLFMDQKGTVNILECEDTNTQSNDDLMFTDETNHLCEENLEPHFSSSEETHDIEDGLSISSNEDLYDEEEEKEEENLNDIGDIHGTEEKKNIPLYKDAPISLDESLLLVLTFALRHNLSGVAIVDLLKLVSLHCREEECKLKPSLYFFKKHFSHLKAPVKLHYFCSECYEPLTSSKSKCTNFMKHKNKIECCYFLELSLEEQIQTHFKRKGFFESLQHRYSKEKVHQEQTIEDIYDAQLYKEQVESGFLGENNKCNFSFIWSTDGVPVFASSRTSMWPVYFAFNELPFRKRFKKENIILGGIWYGAKPRMNLMIEPFVLSLKNVRKGIEVQPYGSDKKIIAKGILLCGTADLPAKADILGLKHVGGSYSCAICKIKGMSVNSNEEDNQETPATAEEAAQEEEYNPVLQAGSTAKPQKKRVSTVWVFPYSNQLELRQHKEMEIFAYQALEKRQSGNNKAEVYGVKWPTYVSKIMPDMVRGFGIDDLHHTYHGVCHKLIELWTLSKYKKQPWSVFRKLDLVDRRLQTVRLPNFVQCGIRSIRNLSLWKAKDYKTFMLYLALPILERILPNVYLDHFAGFVNCVFILNSSCITSSDLQYCSETLDTFVRQFQEFYGVRHMTMNIHNTLHLVFICTNLGPMRCYSCFPFESLNGEVLKMIHGTRFVQIQLANCAYYVMSLPHELETCGSAIVRNYAHELHHSYQKIRILEKISPDYSIAGNYLKVKTLSDPVKMLLKSEGFNIDFCKVFTKLKKETLLFVAQCYKRSTKTESCFVSYLNGVTKCFGVVQYFVRLCQCLRSQECNCKVLYYAVVQKANERRFSSLGTCTKKVNHIFRYVLQDHLQLIPIDKLLHICFSISIPGKDPLFCERVNWLEME